MIQYVDAKVLGTLIQLPGHNGQGLSAVYATLLATRNAIHCHSFYKNSNNKRTSGYRLLAKNSGLSINTLKKYVPDLIELGLCRFTDNGSLLMTGKKKLSKKKKFVKVIIGRNLAETKNYVNGIIICGNIRNQRTLIDKKITLSIILCKLAKDIPLTKKECRLYKNAVKNGGINLHDLKKVENTVLSNSRISDLITHNLSQSPSLGTYYRKKFVENGQILSRRRFKRVVDHKMSWEHFISIRKSLYDNYGFVTYRKGYVVQPIASEVAIPYDISSRYNSRYIVHDTISIGVGDAEANASLTIVNTKKSHL